MSDFGTPTAGIGADNVATSAEREQHEEMEYSGEGGTGSAASEDDERIDEADADEDPSSLSVPAANESCWRHLAAVFTDQLQSGCGADDESAAVGRRLELLRDLVADNCPPWETEAAYGSLVGYCLFARHRGTNMPMVAHATLRETPLAGRYTATLRSVLAGARDLDRYGERVSQIVCRYAEENPHRIPVTALALILPHDSGSRWPDAAGRRPVMEDALENYGGSMASALTLNVYRETQLAALLRMECCSAEALRFFMDKVPQAREALNTRHSEDLSTPVHFCVKMERGGHLELLLAEEYGADGTLQDHKGRTPDELARLRGKKNCLGVIAGPARSPHAARDVVPTHGSSSTTSPGMAGVGSTARPPAVGPGLTKSGLNDMVLSYLRSQLPHLLPAGGVTVTTSGSVLASASAAAAVVTGSASPVFLATPIADDIACPHESCRVYTSPSSARKFAGPEKMRGSNGKKFGPQQFLGTSEFSGRNRGQCVGGSLHVSDLKPTPTSWKSSVAARASLCSGCLAEKRVLKVVLQALRELCEDSGSLAYGRHFACFHGVRYGCRLSRLESWETDFDIAILSPGKDADDPPLALLFEVKAAESQELVHKKRGSQGLYQLSNHVKALVEHVIGPGVGACCPDWIQLCLASPNYPNTGSAVQKANVVRDLRDNLDEFLLNAAAHSDPMIKECSAMKHVHLLTSCELDHLAETKSWLEGVLARARWGRAGSTSATDDAAILKKSREEYQKLLVWLMTHNSGAAVKDCSRIMDEASGEDFGMKLLTL